MPPLSSVGSFAVLAGQTVTNTGPTVLAGDLGLSPGTAITGFPPGQVLGGATHAADAVALQAQADLVLSYDALASQPCEFDSTGVDLVGRTLAPGVYCFTSGAQLSGELVLDAQGLPDAVFVFQIASTLITASNATVRMINAGETCNVFWQVGSSATLGTGTTFVGSILALTSIQLGTGATVAGRALARNGAVTLDSNQVSPGACGVTAPPVCRDLGAAAPYDVFTVGDFSGHDGAVAGAVASGGDFFGSSFSIGQGLAPGQLALLIGGDVRYTNGSVNGDLVYGGEICWICDVTVAGTITPGHPVDFVAAGDYLSDLSASLGALPASGTVTVQGTSLLLVGTNTGLNVFSVTAAQLAGARSVDLQVPASAQVLINVVGGGTVQLRDLTWNANGLPAGRTLINAAEATRVELQGSTVEASLLAPGASVQFDGGLVTGQIVSQSMAGGARIESAPWSACIEAP